jgi:hypothetical protein
MPVSAKANPQRLDRRRTDQVKLTTYLFIVIIYLLFDGCVHIG